MFFLNLCFGCQHTHTHTHVHMASVALVMVFSSFWSVFSLGSRKSSKGLAQEKTLAARLTKSKSKRGHNVLDGRTVKQLEQKQAWCARSRQVPFQCGPNNGLSQSESSCKGEVMPTRKAVWKEAERDGGGRHKQGNPPPQEEEAGAERSRRRKRSQKKKDCSSHRAKQHIKRCNSVACGLLVLASTTTKTKEIASRFLNTVSQHKH